MYFPFFKLKKWGKQAAEARRHNCAVLSKGKEGALPPVGSAPLFYTSF